METYKLADRIPHDCTLTISVSARLEAEVRYGFHPNHGNQT